MNFDVTMIAALMGAIGYVISTGKWENLIGLVLPPVVQFVNMRFKNSNVRLGVALLISLIVASLLNWQKLWPFQPAEILQNLGVIFMAAHASFKLWWENSALSMRIQNNYDKGVALKSGDKDFDA